MDPGHGFVEGFTREGDDSLSCLVKITSQLRFRVASDRPLISKFVFFLISDRNSPGAGG
jgi:hypothetical protein